MSNTEEENLVQTGSTGKCYIDPESTQIFIAALVKEREDAANDDTETVETELA